MTTTVSDATHVPASTCKCLLQSGHLAKAATGWLGRRAGLGRDWPAGLACWAGPCLWAWFTGAFWDFWGFALFRPRRKCASSLYGRPDSLLLRANQAVAIRLLPSLFAVDSGRGVDEDSAESRKSRFPAVQLFSCSSLVASSRIGAFPPGPQPTANAQSLLQSLAHQLPHSPEFSLLNGEPPTRHLQNSTIDSDSDPQHQIPTASIPSHTSRLLATPALLRITAAPPASLLLFLRLRSPISLPCAVVFVALPPRDTVACPLCLVLSKHPR